MKHVESEMKPVTRYVTDTSRWEDWKAEYRYGALYFFPPRELRNTVNQLRTKFDPKSQSYCDAHISLTVPFPKPLTLSVFKEIEQAALLIQPIDITYGPVTSYPGHAGVVLKIEPADRLRDLVQSLEELPAFEGAQARRYPFSAHMTIAEFITLDRTAELVQELSGERLEGVFRCERLSYAVPNDDFHFEERGYIKFGN